MGIKTVKRFNGKNILRLMFLAMSLAFGAVCISADDSTTDVEQKAANTSTIDVLELSDMDILDVIRVVVKKTGMNIVAGQNVTGKVTIFLKNVDARDALRIILESNGLAYADEDGILRVMTAQDFEQKYGHKFGENIQTKIVPLSFAEASDVVAILSQMKTPSGKVFSEEKSNLHLTDAQSPQTTQNLWTYRADLRKPLLL